MKNALLILIALVIIGGGIYYATMRTDTDKVAKVDDTSVVTPTLQPTPAPTPSPSPVVATTTNTTVGPKTYVVNITDGGYEPKDITISKSDSIKWVNSSKDASWPASAAHPTHTVYPGSSIQKCGTAEASGIFDACRGLKEGEAYTFKFDSAGTWKYHDHLNPVHFGSITVEL